MHKTACDQLPRRSSPREPSGWLARSGLALGEWSLDRADNIETMPDRKPARARALIRHCQTFNPIGLAGPNNRSEYWLLVLGAC